MWKKPFHFTYMRFQKKSHAQCSYIKGLKAGFIFVNLSKTFDTIKHSLLLAKLNAYGFSDQYLGLLQSGLCTRFQRNKINRSFGSCNEVTTGLPQGSILDPLLFNKFLNDVFFCFSGNVNYVIMPIPSFSKNQVKI